MIDIKDLQQLPEGQQFDRKSFRIDAKALGVILIAFANADGGDVVIGIEDDGRITGVNGNEDHLNELLRSPFDLQIKESTQKTTQKTTQKSDAINEKMIIRMYPTARPPV